MTGLSFKLERPLFSKTKESTRLLIKMEMVSKTTSIKLMRNSTDSISQLYSAQILMISITLTRELSQDIDISGLRTKLLSTDHCTMELTTLPSENEKS